jgi:long-chain acyl-CoA synthetase
MIPLNLGALIDPGRPQDKVAVTDFDGEQRRNVTYRALDALANGVARALVNRGFRRGDRIGILAANSSFYLAIHLGIMCAGLVSVPINFRLPRHAVDDILKDCGARLVFCDIEHRALLPDNMDALNFDDAKELGSFVDPGSFEAVAPDKAEPATFLYTSGSTGRPKGVVLSHDAQRWVIEMRLRAPGLEDQQVLIAAPLYHMNALALSHLVLAAHASMVLMPRFKVKPYIEAIDRFRCTWLTAVPPMIAMMLDDREAMANADLSSVQYLRIGSAPASATLLDKIRRTFPNAEILNAYGTTEGSPIVFGPHPQGKPTPDLSLGYKHPSVDLRLVDEAGAEADEGVLQLRSPGLMSGYHNRPDLPPPFTPDGYYITGDIFSRDADGFYYFVGRADDMFVSGGENIFPGEVERMLETHPDVIQASVVPIDDPLKGQKPVAFVRLAPGSTIDTSELKAFALRAGAAYQHPRSIWFLEEFPLTSTNKIDRAALMQRARNLSQRHSAVRT